MATNTQSRKRLKLEPIARSLFMGGKSQKEVSDHLNVSENTISKWAKNGDWDAERKRTKNSPSQLMQWMYDEIEKVRVSVGENPISSKEAHVIKMLSSTIRELDKKIDPVVVIDVFTGFINWLKSQNLELAKQIVDVQHQYVQKLINDGE